MDTPPTPSDILFAASQSLARARTRLDSADEDAWRSLQALYDNDPRQVMLAFVAEVAPNLSAQINGGALEWHRYLNLPRMFCDTLGVCMQAEPETWLEDATTGARLSEDDPRVTQWEADQKAISLGVTLQDIEARVTLFGWSAVGVEIVRGVPRWRPHEPYRVLVDWDPAEPECIDAARGIHVALPDQSPRGGSSAAAQSVSQQPIMQWASWLRVEGAPPTWWHVCQGRDPRAVDAALDLGQRLFAGAESLYGMHPFALWRTRRPPTGQVHLPPRWDWLRLTQWTNYQLIFFARSIAFQAASVPVFSGAWDDPSVVLEPGRAQRTTDPLAKFEFVSSGAHFTEIIEGINAQLRFAAVTEGLPPDTWEANSSTRNASAKKIEREALTLTRDRVSQRYVKALHDTFAVHVAVCDAHARQVGGPARVLYGSGVRLGVRLATPPQFEDTFQTAQTRAIEYASGTRDPRDDVAARERITVDEAEERIRSAVAFVTSIRTPAPASMPSGPGGETDTPPDQVEQGDG